MRRLSRTLFAFVVAGLLAGIALAEQPDFSGNWALNKDKSTMFSRRGRQGAITLQISRSADQIQVSQKVETPRGDRNMEMILKPGQGPVSQSGRMGGTAEARWEEGKLVVKREGKRQTPRGEMDIHETETWELSADGRTLTRTVIMQTPRGERTQKWVFEKQ